MEKESQRDVSNVASDELPYWKHFGRSMEATKKQSYQ
jgi:hypothetical protein